TRLPSRRSEWHWHHADACLAVFQSANDIVFRACLKNAPAGLSSSFLTLTVYSQTARSGFFPPPLEPSNRSWNSPRSMAEKADSAFIAKISSRQKAFTRTTGPPFLSPASAALRLG